MKSDGTVISWGSKIHTPVVPKGLTNVKAIQAGANNNIAIKNDGTVVNWGHRTDLLKLPADLSDVADISLGMEHNAAVMRTGGVFGLTQLREMTKHSLFCLNQGAQTISGLRFVLEGADADQFAVLAPLPSSIASGAQSPMTVAFKPTRVGELSALLKVYSTSPVCVFTMPLKGTSNFDLTATKRSSVFGGFTYDRLTTDPMTGLLLQTISFTNPTGGQLHGLRLKLSKLTPGVLIYSSSTGDLAGTIDVYYTNPIGVGETVSFTLTYFDPKRRKADSMIPLIKAEALLVPEPRPGPISGTQVTVRSVRDTAQGPLLEWNAVATKTYVVEYSNDRGRTWVSAAHRLSGGTRIIWVDRGQPETESKPLSMAARMYRVKQL